MTATLDDAGVGWPDDVADGWTETGPTTATYPVLFGRVVYPVPPTDPEVAQATCTDGEVTVPTVELASSRRGSPMWLDPAGPYDATDGDAR